MNPPWTNTQLIFQLSVLLPVLHVHPNNVWLLPSKEIFTTKVKVANLPLVCSFCIMCPSLKNFWSGESSCRTQLHSCMGVISGYRAELAESCAMGFARQRFQQTTVPECWILKQFTSRGVYMDIFFGLHHSGALSRKVNAKTQVNNKYATFWGCKLRWKYILQVARPEALRL